jgi:hypothetical protein
MFCMGASRCGAAFSDLPSQCKIAEHRIANRDQPVTRYILEGPTVVVVSMRLEF